MGCLGAEEHAQTPSWEPSAGLCSTGLLSVPDLISVSPALTHQAVQSHHLLLFIDVHRVHQELKET